MIILKLNDQQKHELLMLIKDQKDVLERMYVFEKSRGYDDLLLMDTESGINSMDELLHQLTDPENAAFELTEKGLCYAESLYV